MITYFVDILILQNEARCSQDLVTRDTIDSDLGVCFEHIGYRARFFDLTVCDRVRDTILRIDRTETLSK
jgi:hypothetical protein